MMMLWTMMMRSLAWLHLHHSISSKAVSTSSASSAAEPKEAPPPPVKSPVKKKASSHKTKPPLEKLPYEQSK
jgi:hypothetical protein